MKNSTNKKEGEGERNDSENLKDTSGSNRLGAKFRTLGRSFGP
jgi:hypothetical protein